MGYDRIDVKAWIIQVAPESGVVENSPGVVQPAGNPAVRRP